MPLDTGATVDGVVSLEKARRAAGRAARPAEAKAPSLNDPTPLGEVLKAVRQHKGLDLEDLAEVTRVRASYLDAIEAMRMEQLPSRPFVLGYVRAYAMALGLDGDLAAARFKMEAPEGSAKLRAPVGVRREGDPRLKLLGLIFALVAAAIITWNVVQHLLVANTPARPTAEVAQGPAKAQPAVPTGAPLALGAPLPAPAESTTPQPYVTPGLEQALAPVAAQAAAATPAAPPAGSPFVAHGAIYGASAGQSPVVIQARKAAGLVVHGADGSVYFARQLAAGEAYRAPQIAGLTLDVSEPDKFEVYVGGVLKGPLTSPKTAATSLASAKSAT
jgi:transcriptional regulator with XRE-family HTH domain